MNKLIRVSLIMIASFALLGYGYYRLHQRSVTVTTNMLEALESPVPDGVVVLVKKDKTYGAFILKNQKTDPEQTSYLWCYRTDGSGNFQTSEKDKVKCGSGSTADQSSVIKSIKFGPFNIWWSGHEEGSGYLYHEFGVPAPTNLQICVTNATDMRKIDAANPKWIYKSHSPFRVTHTSER